LGAAQKVGVEVVAEKVVRVVSSAGVIVYRDDFEAQAL
jgi:hypothetical protein